MGEEKTKSVSGHLQRKRIAMAIIALCVALTIAEMICRHVFPPVSPDAFSQWANRRIVCESLDEYRTTMTFGPYGYRNPTLPLERRAGVARIVALGDSLTEGVGTDDDGTWPQVCARRLKELGHPAEIANLGENGSDPGGYLVRLAQMGVALKPDIVICCVFQNDVMDPTDALQKMPGFDPVVKRAISPPGGLALPKLFESLIRTGRRPPSPSYSQPAFPSVPDPRNPFTHKSPMLDTRFHEAAKHGKFNPWLLSLPRDYYDRLALAQDKNTLGAMWAVRIALDRMREICNRESIAFFVIYIPEQSAFSEQRKEVLEQLGFSTEHVPAPVDYVRESIERWAAANSVPFLDMSPRLRIEPDAYYRWDLHLTPKGYRIVGEAVAEWRALLACAFISDGKLPSDKTVGVELYNLLATGSNSDDQSIKLSSLLQASRLQLEQNRNIAAKAYAERAVETAARINRAADRAHAAITLARAELAAMDDHDAEKAAVDAVSFAEQSEDLRCRIRALAIRASARSYRAENLGGALVDLQTAARISLDNGLIEDHADILDSLWPLLEVTNQNAEAAGCLAALSSARLGLCCESLARKSQEDLARILLKGGPKPDELEAAICILMILEFSLNRDTNVDLSELVKLQDQARDACVEIEIWNNHKARCSESVSHGKLTGSAQQVIDRFTARFQEWLQREK